MGGELQVPTGLSVLEVIIAILVSFTGLIAALMKVIQAVRNKWIEDNRNTEAVRANTSAVQELSRTVAAQSAQLSRQDDRLERIELHLKLGR